MKLMVDWRSFRATGFLILAVCVLSTVLLASGPWQVIGPDGGDARSLAYDAHNPDHIFLGTSTGQMFSSNDGGRTWSRLAHLGGDDYVLDHIVVDPQNSNRVYVSAWSTSSQQLGEIFRTRRWWPHLGDSAGHAWQVHPRDGHVSRQFRTSL